MQCRRLARTRARWEGSHGLEMFLGYSPLWEEAEACMIRCFRGSTLDSDHLKPKQIQKILNISNYQRNGSQNHNEVSPHTCQNVYH